MHIWLDLEETIINNWNDGLLINVSRIKKWLADNNISNIHIWSFAIWNDSDQLDFVDSGMKDSIERALDCKILTYMSVAQMEQAVYEYERFRYDSQSEFMQLNGKRWSFIKYCLLKHPTKKCILIDDAVPTLEMKVKKTQGEIHLINIDDI